MVFSSTTYEQTDGSGAWVFNNGFSISTGKGYATGNATAIKYSKNEDFTINIPEGKQVTSFTVEAYTNYDDANGYLVELNGETYSSTQYVFPRKSEGTTSTYTIPFEEPVKGTLPFRFSGNQVGAIITLSIENAASAVEEISADRNPNQRVDVYNSVGILILKQVPYNEIFNKLPQGLYILNNKEKLIIR